jgi:branched-chain amino acid transport system substrate-binding protein
VRTLLDSIRAAALLLAVAPQLIACAPTRATPAVHEADSLYIAVAANRRAVTEAYFEGTRIAVEHLNANRPEGSRPFAVLAPADSLAGAVDMATFFRDHPGVIGVVGNTGSGQTREAAPIYADVQGGGARAVVAVSPTATHPSVTGLSEWIFRVCPTDDDAARALAHFATDSLGMRRAAIIYRNDLFGRGFTRIFGPAFESGGGVVLERDPYLAGITEYEAYSARIAQRRADLVVIAGGAQDAVDMIRSMRRLGASPRIIGTDDLSGINADVTHAREFAGVRYTAFYLPGRSPDAGLFERDYLRTFGRDPEHRAALSYDAAMLIGQAAIEVGADRRRIRDRIARVGNEAPAHAGVTGEIRFSPQGDPIAKPVHMGEVRP